MKTIISTFLFLFLSANFIIAQSDDAAVQGWVFAPWMKYNIPAEGIEAYQRYSVLADTVPNNFDPINGNFDLFWTSTVNTQNAMAHQLGLAASDHGASDFEGSFKVLYDNNNIYIMIKANDDDITGNEIIELMWAPYLRVNSTLDGIDKNSLRDPSRFYMRFSDFGAYKIVIKSTGFSDAMIVASNPANFNIVGINWAGTNNLISANTIFVDEKTEAGTKVIKKIVTIPFTALTGIARPDFNTSIWRSLNGGKGISFDIKFTDVDTDDALNTATPAVQKPAEYWWNTTHNDGYAVTYLSGFVGLKTLTGLNQISVQNSIFEKVTKTNIYLRKTSDIVIYNLVGKSMLSLNNVNRINLKTLKSGVYIVRANNETLKVVI